MSRAVNPLRRLGLPALLLIVPFLLLAGAAGGCSGTTVTTTLHLKQPVAAVRVTLSRSGSDVERLYVASALLDRVSVVDLRTDNFVLHPHDTRPGVVHIRTGRHPVDLAHSTAAGANNLYVLNGVGGYISVADLSTDAVAPTASAPTALAPKECAPDAWSRGDANARAKCWQQPVRLVVATRKNGKARGFVAIAGTREVVSVGLTKGEADHGKVERVFQLPSPGIPADLALVPGTTRLLVADRMGSRLWSVDTETLARSSIDIGAPVARIAVATDGKLAVMIDAEGGGVLLVDLASGKALDHGEKRYPNSRSLPLPGGPATDLSFIPTKTIEVNDADGVAKNVEGTFLLATCSDGYAYVLSIGSCDDAGGGKRSCLQMLDADLKSPTVTGMTLKVGDRTVGDPRSLPQNQVRVPPSDDSRTFTPNADKARSQIWSFLYEGVVLSGRAGRFTAKGKFSDPDTRFKERMVQKGDLLVHRGTCTPSQGKKSCEFKVLSVTDGELEVDTGGAVFELNKMFSYEIRTAASFLVTGSSTGMEEKRLVPGTGYQAEEFTVTFLPAEGSDATPPERGTVVSVTVDGLHRVKAVKLGGIPTRFVGPVKDDTIFVLDTSIGQILKVKTDAIALERTIR